MSSRPYMKFWVDDYAGATSHLTTFEHGVYFLLLLAMWRSPDGWLPDDDVRLARCVRTRLDRWLEVAPTIREFLVSEAGRISQKRLLTERQAAACTGAKRTEVASARWASKSLKNLNGNDANASDLQCKTHASHSHSQKEPTVPLPLSVTNVPSSGAPPRKKKTKPRTSVDLNWQIEPKHIAAAAHYRCDEATARREWPRFKDHHQALGNLMADWDAAWRTWISRPFKKATEGPVPQGSLPLTKEERQAAMQRIIEQNRLENERAKNATQH